MRQELVSTSFVTLYDNLAYCSQHESRAESRRLRQKHEYDETTVQGAIDRLRYDSALVHQAEQDLSHRLVAAVLDRRYYENLTLGRESEPVTRTA